MNISDKITLGFSPKLDTSSTRHFEKIQNIKFAEKCLKINELLLLYELFS